MIIRSFYYGTAGPEKGGYGYLYDSQEISPQNPHISSNTGTCIRYGSIANVYTLQFVTALNKSKTDSRRQTFIHGYVFDKEAALELMKKPEYIPFLKHNESPDQPPILEIKSWDGLHGKKIRDKFNKEMEHSYFHVIFDNAQEQTRELFHISSGTSTQNAGIICSYLKTLPLQLRIDITWTSMLSDLGEGDFEINFISPSNYQRLEEKMFDGATFFPKPRIMYNKDSENGIRCLNPYIEEAYDIWSTSDRKKKEVIEKLIEQCENRQQILEILHKIKCEETANDCSVSKAKSKVESQVKEHVEKKNARQKKHRKRRHIQKRTRRNVQYMTGIFLLIESIVAITLLIFIMMNWYTFAATQVKEFTFNVSSNAIILVLVFLAGMLTHSLIEDMIFWRRKILDITKKERKND